MNTYCLYREWKEFQETLGQLESVAVLIRSHSEALFGDLVVQTLGRLVRIQVTFEGSAGETAAMIQLPPPSADYFFHQGRFYKAEKGFSWHPPTIVRPLNEDETKKLMNDQSFVRSVTGSDT